ncbi:MAG: Sensor protein FixL [Phycisphaerae bacterium]|nr:Sensor protein FixL [Phycisphaerae bacterium]
MNTISTTASDPASAGASPLDDPRSWTGEFAEQILQTQKLAAMGTMAAMLAHEFNNILTRVINYAENSLGSPDDRELADRSMQRILDNANKAAEICQSIFDFSGRGDERRRPVVIADIVREAVNCLGRDPAKDNIAVRSRVAPDITVMGNATLLQQVVFNLLLNARQAILATSRRGGQLTLAGERTPDGGVELRVSDTGCGIAAEHLEKIWTPFFSTKNSEERTDRKGIGLGLPICRSIVQDHGGTITVASEPGVGTTFTIRLPGN